MKKLILICALAFATPLALVQTGCQHTVTLEAGGAYADPTIATIDHAILDASHALTAFLDWNAANAPYLAKWPEVGALATRVAAQKDGWIRDAYFARDAYASASAAYKAGKASAPPSNANLNAALAVLSNVTQQIIDYKTAHPQAL
jgi:hypothetical protein